jgi:hypothetical protein
MASAEEILDEVMGTNPPANHHNTVMGDGGPAPYVGHTMQDKLSHVAHEVTYFLPRRVPTDPFLQPGNAAKRDTTLGHSIDAASFGRLNFLILQRIAAKLDVDIDDLLR